MPPPISPPAPSGPVHALPISDWPAGDRAAWTKAFEAAGLFDPQGLGVHLAPATRGMLERGYGTWLGFLAEGGTLKGDEPDDRGLPADRVTLERLKAYIARHQGRILDTTVGLYLHNLRRALKLIAPEEDWSRIARLRERYLATHHSKRDKRSRIVDARALYRLGLDLMARAQSDTKACLERRLILYRDGLMVALLTACPVRRGNFTGIRIGLHLTRDGDGYRLSFEAHETKSRRPIEMPILEPLTPWIDHYLDEIRPQLLALGGLDDLGDSDAFWITKDGDPAPACVLYKQIKARTKKAFGKPVNPHLFRDCAATSIAEQDPEHVRIAQDVLGHATFKTTEENYLHARQRKAAARHQKSVQQLKRDLGVRRLKP